MRLVYFLFNKIICFIFLIILLFQPLQLNCSHNTSRYFYFLERPAEYVLKNKSHFSPSVFYSQASVAFRRGGGDSGIPELWGFYDLQNVITSLEKVTGKGFVNPIEQEKGPNDSWIDKSIRYKVNGKLKAWGFIFNYEQVLNWYNLSIGASLPIMHVHTNDSFAFMPTISANKLQNLTDSEKNQLDRIRRNVHNDLGLYGGNWTKDGFGDLDLHLGWNSHWNRTWLIRSIDWNFRSGITIPTESNSDTRYSSSVSFMGNGHWSWYFDFLSELELKHDWKFGLLLGAMYQFKNIRKLRTPVYNEPAIFSALIADIEIDPGMTLKLSPYLIADNLTDGVGCMLRYTYLRHNIDIWKDKRSNPVVKSYLNQEPGTVLSGQTVTAEDIANNISAKKDLSKWRAHYFSFEVFYDSKEAGGNWMFDPIIYLNFDYQFSGNGVCKTHQLTLGVEAHF